MIIIKIIHSAAEGLADITVAEGQGYRFESISNTGLPLGSW